MFDKATLATILSKHGYKPNVMTPEWCLFALEIRQLELLEEIKNEIRKEST